MLGTISPGPFHGQQPGANTSLLLQAMPGPARLSVSRAWCSTHPTSATLTAGVHGTRSAARPPAGENASHAHLPSLCPTVGSGQNPPRARLLRWQGWGNSGTGQGAVSSCQTPPLSGWWGDWWPNTWPGVNLSTRPNLLLSLPFHSLSSSSQDRPRMLLSSPVPPIPAPAGCPCFCYSLSCLKPALRRTQKATRPRSEATLAPGPLLTAAAWCPCHRLTLSLHFPTAVLANKRAGPRDAHGVRVLSPPPPATCSHPRIAA